MVQEDDVIPSDLVMGNVAVGLRQMLEKNDGILRAEFAQGEPEQVALETMREAIRAWFRGWITNMILYGGCHGLSLVGHAAAQESGYRSEIKFSWMNLQNILSKRVTFISTNLILVKYCI